LDRLPLDALSLDALLDTGYAVAGPIFMAHLQVTCVGFFIGYISLDSSLDTFLDYGYLTLGGIMGTLGLFLRCYNPWTSRDFFFGKELWRPDFCCEFYWNISRCIMHVLP
jgi:hypothetical protein